MTPNPRRRRGVSLALYVATAVGFAALMILLGMLPTDSIRASIQLNSLGSLTIVHVAHYIFAPFQGPLASLQLPEWAGYALSGLVAALYSLIITLPSYFYFRTGQPWLLAIQAFSLASHIAFALLVVAPFWISM